MRYRKKPVVVEAKELTAENWQDVQAWIIFEQGRVEPWFPDNKFGGLQDERIADLQRTLAAAKECYRRCDVDSDSETCAKKSGIEHNALQLRLSQGIRFIGPAIRPPGGG